MLDIRKIKHSYWWNADKKFESLINNENKLKELTFQITDRCNLNCEKCNKKNFTFKDIETSKIIDIIDQAVLLGLEHLHLTGGEPTLHESLPHIINYCKTKYQLRIDMSSNGMFDKDKGKQLIEAGIDSINVSWDFVDNKPTCIDFIDSLGKIEVFINHMVMPANYKELCIFLQYIKDNYPFIVDIQLMPPRGTAERFNKEQILEFKEISKSAFKISRDRFFMVENKALELLDGMPEKGIYHKKIEWPCYRGKTELRVGGKGFTTCTYLYRDGHILCDLNTSVKDAWDKCKQMCLSSPPIPEMCDFSCSPEVACFNYFVEKEQLNDKSLAC